MLADTRRSFLGHYHFVSALNLISELLNKSGKFLIYLATPEDTTVSGAEGQSPIVKYNRNYTGGLAKAAFWIVNAISIAIFIGRLC